MDNLSHNLSGYDSNPAPNGDAHQARAPKAIVEIWLGYLGLLPFIYLLLPLPVPIAVSQADIFIGYSCIILAFMAGSLWRHSAGASILSNVIAVAAFIILLLPLPLTISLILLVVLYLDVLWWEAGWCRGANGYPLWYWQLRYRLTTAVVICHGVLLVKVLI